MRTWPLVFLAVLGGCGPPPRDRAVPELRLVWTEAGALVSGQSGDVPLDPVTRGCARKTRLQVQNGGLASGTVSMSTSSLAITVPAEPLTVEPGEAQDVEARVAAPDPLAAMVEADLVLALEGQPSLQFQLHAAVHELDPARPRAFDFAGVELGTTVGLSAPALLGLTGDFTQAPGQLQFSPRLAGRQELAASYDSMLDCPALSAVTVVGDGVPAVLSGPATVNFGDVRVGDGIELDVAVQNLSYDELQVTLPGPDFTIVSTSSTPTVASRDPRGVLVPGARSQRIHFSPTVAGAVTGQLEATAGARRLVIPLRAVGTP